MKSRWFHFVLRDHISPYVLGIAILVLGPLLLLPFFYLLWKVLGLI